MRHTLKRAVLLLVVATVALGPLVACEKDPSYYFEDGRTSDESYFETETGEALDLGVGELHFRNTGCACSAKEELSKLTTAVDYSVEPAEGATVSDKGIFTATRPGTYTVMVSGRYGSASATVAVTGEDLAGEDEPPVETEEPEVSPLVGTWSWTPWWPQQKWTPEGGVSEHEWEWLIGKGPANFTIEQSGDAYVVGDWLVGSQIAVDGTHVVIVNTSPGWLMTLDGTVSGDTITGTQSYEDDNAGSLSLEWAATRVH